MDRVADALGNAEVIDIDGKPHRLGELWRERPAVLLWVRHFG